MMFVYIIFFRYKDKKKIEDEALKMKNYLSFASKV